MSVDEPTVKQITAFKKLHSKNLGYMQNLLTGERTSNELITFCEHCKDEWPCKSMKAFGVKS